MYLVVSTMPDMAQAINVLARFCENPTKEHLTAAKHLLAYLKELPSMVCVSMLANLRVYWVMRMRILLEI